jgi:hypothetical protein
VKIFWAKLFTCKVIILNRLIQEQGLIKRYIKKQINNEFFLSKTIFFGLAFLTLLSAVVIYDNPSVFSALLFSFCIFLIIQSYFYSRIYKASVGLKVADIMIPKAMLTVLNHATHTTKALEIISKSFQEIYPVFYNDNFYGIITKDNFLASLSSGIIDAYVSDFTEKKFEFIYSDEKIQKLLSGGRLKAARVMVVFDQANNFLGLLSYEKLIEYLLIEKAIKESKNREIQDEFFL